MIGIFPLGIVLFPESVIQLHIFEEKYKVLINHCLNTDINFGVNTVLSSKIQKIGCTAKIVDVLKKYPDGKMDIIVKGKRKYLIRKRNVGPFDYIEADIDLIDEDNEYPDIQTIEECVRIYNTIAEEVKSLKLNKIDSSLFYSITPSYFFAQKAGLTIEQKYHLLQLSSENKRLNYILSHLKEVEPLLKETEIMNQIIRNDGYGRYV